MSTHKVREIKKTDLNTRSNQIRSDLDTSKSMARSKIKRLKKMRMKTR